MKTTQSANSIMAALGLLSTLLPISQTAHAQDNLVANFVAPAVFQAAGPTTASIQGTVDAFRAALGDPNNGNTTWASGSPNLTLNSITFGPSAVIIKPT